MKTIEDATREWVNGWNYIPFGLIESSWRENPSAWNEVTPPMLGDRVYVCDAQEKGTIIGLNLCDGDDEDEDETAAYRVELDGGEAVKADEGGLEVEYDGAFPMWYGLWTFSESDNDWARDHLREMAACGLRIYEHDDCTELFFGIDGAGYNFFTEHWIPLYKARGLQWHDERAVS